MTYLQAIRLARAADLPPHLSHAFLVLATHWPNIHPSQERLAQEMHISRRQVNERLKDLEALGFVERWQRDERTTIYRLHFKGGYVSGR